MKIFRDFSNKTDKTAVLQVFIVIGLITILGGGIVVFLPGLNKSKVGVFLIFFLAYIAFRVATRMTGVSLPTKFGDSYKTRKGFNGFWKDILWAFLFAWFLSLFG